MTLETNFDNEQNRRPLIWNRKELRTREAVPNTTLPREKSDFLDHQQNSTDGGGYATCSQIMPPAASSLLRVMLLRHVANVVDGAVAVAGPLAARAFRRANDFQSADLSSTHQTRPVKRLRGKGEEIGEKADWRRPVPVGANACPDRFLVIFSTRCPFPETSSSALPRGSWK